MEEGKTIKQYCKEAKKRMKQGFWQDYKKNLDEEIRRGEEKGIAAAKIKEYYSEKARDDIRIRAKIKKSFIKKSKIFWIAKAKFPTLSGGLPTKSITTRFPTKKNRDTL